MKTSKIKKFRANQSSKSFNLSKHCIVLLSAIVSVNVAFANPQGGSVTSGSATISSSGNSTVVTQSSQQAIINWNSFNIQKNESTQFVQPSSSAVALNRINPSQGASQIYGSLSSNGKIILVNAAGINFQSGSTVNVGSMIASTSDILDSNFLAGNYVFDQVSAYHNPSIVNKGSIIAANYGLIALLGSTVTNSGMIKAEMGSVALGAGNTFTLSFNGDQLINFTVNTPSSSASISNTGSLVADGGQVLVSAQTAANVLNNVVNLGGVTQANSVATQNGEIILSTNAGADVTGKVYAEGSTGLSGGTIQMSANYLTTSSQANINASGDTAGGTIDFNAGTIAIAGQVNASGTGAASFGGSVTLTSDAIQVACGSILYANGGSFGGTITFAAADSSANSYVSVGNDYIEANGTMAGSFGGTINFNSASTTFSNSFVAAQGLGTGSFGGNINVASNNIYIENGTLISTAADFLGGNVTLSGVPVAGNQTNAANIYLDGSSVVDASVYGTDGVIGGTINMYGNSVQINGAVGSIDNANTAFGIGGNINIYGQNINIGQYGVVDADASFVGGIVNLGGNPLSTTSSTASNSVTTGYGSYVGAAATGSDAFGSEINVSANTVSLAGELDVSGTPLPYLTYTYVSNGSSGNNSNNNNMGGMSGGMCGGGGGGGGHGGGNDGGHEVATINNSGSSAGIIDITGNNITVQSTGYLNATGNVFGGEILIGSDPTSGPLTTASININAGSLLDAGSYGTTGSPIGGEIRLYANNTTVNGVLNASAAANAGSLGGEIEVFAQNTVTIGANASLLANGDAGGEILIGGDLNGAGIDPNALVTNVLQHSLISASSLSNGNGGQVVVWSTNATTFGGSIYATGGPQGGNGGQVQVSGSGTVTFQHSAYTNVSAPHGSAGTVTR